MPADDENEAIIEAAPGVPDLQAADDSGASNTDNITKNRILSFDIGSAANGETVELLRNGAVAARGIATSESITLTDNNVPANGAFNYTARKNVNNIPGLQSAGILVTVDTTMPTVSVEQSNSQLDPAKFLPVRFTAVFSEAIVGFEAADVSLAGSTANVADASIQITQANQIYTITVGNIASDGQIRASVLADKVQDLAGNSNAVSTSADNTVTLDTVAPTVTVNQAANQPDPARTIPLNFTVVFSEPVFSFDYADISLEGSTANISNAGIQISGSGTTYNVSINNVTANGQTVKVSVLANAAQDAAGNLNPASASADNVVTLDNIAPSVVINQSVNQPDPTTAQPINFTVVFSEPVTVFNIAGISFLGSTANVSNASIQITGSGTTYNVAIRNIGSNGTIRVSILSNSAVDVAGNPNLPSTGTDNAVTLAPAFANFAGRITNASGRGLARAQISFSIDGEERRAVTNPFGYYRFTNVPTGSITISVSSKNKQTASQTFVLVGNRADVNLVLP